MFKVTQKNDSADPSRMLEFVAELRSRNLLLPVEPTSPEDWKHSFYSKRGHGMHRAVDMMMAMDSPIRAVENGTIARLKSHPLGGITIYQLDPTRRFVYYYAHLSRYAEDLKVGDVVQRGQVIGFVGQTGNARSPHLHFQICKLESPERVWEGTAINPYDVFAKEGELTERDGRLNNES